MLTRFAFVFAFLVSCALSFAAPLAAQSSDTLAIAPGSRLRIATWYDTVPAPALLRRQTRDGLALDGACGACRADSIITWNELQSVDVYTTRPHGVVNGIVGAGQGFLLGTLIGFVTTFASIKLCTASNNSENCEMLVLVLPAASAAGATIGAVMGMRGEDEGWVPVWPKSRR